MVKNNEMGNVIKSRNGIKYTVNSIKSSNLAPLLSIISRYLIDCTSHDTPVIERVITKEGKSKTLYIYFW